MSSNRLFEPLKVGAIELKHRIAMCPLTRYRADDDHVPISIMEEYYAQRASTPGTLIISEGTFISPEQSGYANAPGIYNQAQIDAWKKVTAAVHAKGSFIFCQLWALGRTGDPKVTKKEGITMTSSGDIPVDSEHPAPIPLTLDGIKKTLETYATAAKNAIAAGFDGVELHGANGYLIDQFIQDRTNNRSDTYGGSIENRSRFAVEAVKIVSDAIGADRVGIRFSPFSTFNSMRMENPIPQFSDVITKIRPYKIAYLHLVESRIAGSSDTNSLEKLSFAIDLWDAPLFIAGGYTPELAHKLVNEEHPDKDVVAMFGRYFISSPDLPFRVKNGIELTKYDRSTFYTPMAAKGYTDYSFSKEFLAQA